jgi:hypothetical protein
MLIQLRVLSSLQGTRMHKSKNYYLTLEKKPA